MSNLLINIRFRTMFWQVDRNWKSTFGPSEYWVKEYAKGGVKEHFNVIKFFFYG